MKRRTDVKRRDDAVSPVIGVMLMLVVTIIIAAVVSTFAGGIMGSQEPTPSASFDVSLTDDSIELIVQSTSQDISSKDIMIVLSKTGQTRKLVPGASTVPFGFNIVEWSKVKGFHDSKRVGDPQISETHAAHDNNSKQWFGNYTVKVGSRMSASGNAFTDLVEGLVCIPEGFDKGSFQKSEFLGITVDQWKSVFGDTVTADNKGSDSNVLKVKENTEVTNADLGQYLVGKGVAEFKDGKYKAKTDFWAIASDKNWSFGRIITYGDGYGSISISPGDRVSVTIVYTPSGQTMFTKTVVVKEA